MSLVAKQKRHIRLYLPGIAVGGLCAFIGLEGLVPALEGEIPKLRGVERIISLADSPVAFWWEVFQRAFMMLMVPVFGLGLAWARWSDAKSDGLIHRRSKADQALDKAVRRPLKPDQT